MGKGAEDPVRFGALRYFVFDGGGKALCCALDLLRAQEL